MASLLLRTSEHPTMTDDDTRKAEDTRMLTERLRLIQRQFDSMQRHIDNVIHGTERLDPKRAADRPCSSAGAARSDAIRRR
jgi:hypothetical protein